MSDATEQAIRNGIVILVDQNPERISYFKTVMEFIDYSVETVDDVKALGSRLQELEGNCLAVVLGPDITGANASGYLKVINKGKDSYVPALLQLVEAAGQPHPLAVGEGLIGTITVPCRCEVLKNLMHKAQVYRDQQVGAEKWRGLELFRSLSGASRSTQRIRRMIEQVADSEATVLILGESGTGKEVVARKLHYHSMRRGKPFVPVNCGAIPSELLESELFGHEKGAFTGAINARQGRFELAEGGTLFLDEIGDMSMPMQVKLLRVLQERTFERVGSNKTIHCNVRIIAATHRNLEEAIKENKFREDLYYRLNVFPIEMSPLRERVEDIPVLVTDLIRRIENEKRGSVRLTPTAIGVLCQYSWPGNIRELANLIERLAILYPYGVVDVKELPEKFQVAAGVEITPEELPQVTMPDLAVAGAGATIVARLPQEGIDLKAHLNELEQDLIRQALDESDGVVAHAAKRLKMRRTTLVEKLRKFGMHRNYETTII